MPFKKAQLWLGSQQSYENAIEAIAKAEADPKFSAASAYDSEILSQLMQVQDGVATIAIKGSLINGSAGYGIYYGVTGYDDIRNALAAAVSNPNVSSILLDVGSGGGQVAGVHETAQLITRVSKVKPVVTYTGSMMGSAAVWTGISGQYAVASETAIVGSIGIIMVHMDRTKQLDEMGIKATVIRAGSEKALNSPYEALSDKAKETLQNQANALYDIFIGHVAAARGVSATVADTKFGQGREFLGKQAVEVGLVDKLGTFEDAFTKAIQLGASAKSGSKRAMTGAKADNSGNVQALAGDSTASTVDNQATSKGTPMPKPLTQEQLDAMAAGVELDITASTGDSEQEPENAQDSSAAPAPAAETTAPTEVDALAKADAKAAALQEMLTAAQSDLLTAKAEAKSASEQLTASADALSKFAEIARASVKTMGVHFGVKSEAVAAMDHATILAEHTRLSGLFKDKFKVGGVAATTQEETQKPKATVSPMFAAVLKSTAK